MFMKKLWLIGLLTLAMIGCVGTTADPTLPKTITPRNALTMLENDSTVILLDVRTQSEYLEIRIDGAVLLPLNEITLRAQDVLINKQATIIVYCRSGNRSAQAVQLLHGLGYTNLYDLGGIQSWPYATVSG
jgi:rhodanese-related sulfurtransferase